MADSWCILRCAAQSTIPLLRSLSRAGIDVWTPIERVTRRVPRANVKRVLDRAIIPSYLFVASDHMPAILALLNSPTRDHREFRLFKHNGGVPLINGEALDPLRMLERKSHAKAAEPILRAGDSVKLTDGGFAGMTGTVGAVGKSYSEVTIQGFNLPLKIANFYLLPSSEKCDTRLVA